MTHICVIKLTAIGSDNGLSPERRQAIIWTNAGILLIGPWGTNFNDILIKIHTFSFKKMPLKTLFAKRWPFCLGLNVLKLVVVLWIELWFRVVITPAPLPYRHDTNSLSAVENETAITLVCQLLPIYPLCTTSNWQTLLWAPISTQGQRETVIMCRCSVLGNIFHSSHVATTRIAIYYMYLLYINKFTAAQNDRHSANYIFKCILLNETFFYSMLTVSDSPNDNKQHFFR